jgi:asparagine synthase (glutamine-hydrolysing)
LSAESLAATGYFDAAAVDQARAMQRNNGRRSLQRFAFDMGLAGVISTQLWHHVYFGGGLCELPEWSSGEFATVPAEVSSVA